MSCTDCIKREEFYQTFEEGKPYTQIKLDDGKILREFSPEYPDYFLKWHWDNEDRIISVEEDTDWMFQFDNKLPQKLIPGESIFIKRGTIHRLIKGTSDIKILIIHN